MPEPGRPDVRSEVRSEIRAEVLEALRAYVVAYQDSGHDLARHMGLPITDGLALGEVLWAEYNGAPLTPTGLAHRTALTSGATNALINRLEGRGLVERSREHDDRRIVTLRATDAARARAEEFNGAAAVRLEEALAEQADDDLVVVRDFLRRFAAVLPRSSERA